MSQINVPIVFTITMSGEQSDPVVAMAANLVMEAYGAKDLYPNMIVTPGARQKFLKLYLPDKTWILVAVMGIMPDASRSSIAFKLQELNRLFRSMMGDHRKNDEDIIHVGMMAVYREMTDILDPRILQVI